MQRTTQGTVPDTDTVTDTYTEADINTNKDEDEDTTSIILEHVCLSVCVCVCNFLYGLLRFLKTSDVITQSETSIDSSPSKAISRQN